MISPTRGPWSNMISNIIEPVLAFAPGEGFVSLAELQWMNHLHFLTMHKLNAHHQPLKKKSNQQISLIDPSDLFTFAAFYRSILYSETSLF